MIDGDLLKYYGVHGKNKIVRWGVLCPKAKW